MALMTMTYELANAAAWDAANRLMRKKWPLEAWDEECADLACDTFHRLYGHHVLSEMNDGVCPDPDCCMKAA